MRCARINVLLNRVEDRVRVIAGDLFQPVGGTTFDLVLFNPPYLRGRPKTNLEAAFYADSVAETFARGLPRHLSFPTSESGINSYIPSLQKISRYKRCWRKTCPASG